MAVVSDAEAVETNAGAESLPRFVLRLAVRLEPKAATSLAGRPAWWIATLGRRGAGG